MGRRTAYQPDLGATPAELVLGKCPTVPGVILPENAEETKVEDLLDSLRTNAARLPQPMSSHRQPAINMPDLEKVTHVHIRKGKTTPSGPRYEGPFKITEPIGNSCVRVRVGNFADGTPRLEVHHWENLKPSWIAPNSAPASKPNKGRKPLSAKAKTFIPQKRNALPQKKEQKQIVPQRRSARTT